MHEIKHDSVFLPTIRIVEFFHLFVWVVAILIDV